MKRQGLFVAAALCALGAAGAVFIACTDYYTDLLDEKAQDIGDQVVSQVVENLDKIDMNMPQLQELKDKFVGERDAIADKLGLTETERDAIADKLGITQDDLAKKIEENKGLITEVNNITTERDNYIDRWNTTVIERDKVKDDLNKTTTTLGETKALLDAAGLREETLKQNVADTEDKLQKKKDELAEALAGNNKLEGEKKTLTDKLADVVADAEAKKTEIADLNGKITDLNEEQGKLLNQVREQDAKLQEYAGKGYGQLEKTETVPVIKKTTTIIGDGTGGAFPAGRKVKLSPYAINKYEVTLEMYKDVMGQEALDACNRFENRYDGDPIPNAWPEEVSPSTKGADGKVIYENTVCNEFCCPECMLALYKAGVSSRHVPAKGERQHLRVAYAMSWYDAIAFCNKLSIEQGFTPCYTVQGISDWKNFPYTSIPTNYDEAWSNAKCDFTANGWRMPTEAEWEFAARGGDPNAPDWNYKYPGSDNIDEVGWYVGNTGEMCLKDKKHPETLCYRHTHAATQADVDSGAKKLDGTAATVGDVVPNRIREHGYSWTAYGSGRSHEVGMKKPNRLGLYDMAGNGSEWCWDKYDFNVAGNDDTYKTDVKEKDAVVNPLGAAKSGYPLDSGNYAHNDGRILRGSDAGGCGAFNMGWQCVDGDGTKFNIASDGATSYAEACAVKGRRGAGWPWARCHTGLRYCRTMPESDDTVQGDGGSK